MEPVLLQIYDYALKFDSIDLQKALRDIYDYGVNYDNLALLPNANEEVEFADKTPTGLNDRQTAKDIVLQGIT